MQVWESGSISGVPSSLGFSLSELWTCPIYQSSMWETLKMGGRNLGVAQTPSPPPPSDPHLVDHSIYLHWDDEVSVVHWL